MERTEEKQIAEWKIREISEMKDLLKGKKVVGIISIENLPSSLFQETKRKLREKVDIRISKSNLIERALSESGNKDLLKLVGYIKGPCGILVSNDNPFKIFKILKQNRIKAPPKAGMIAQADIIVPAGDTDLLPGPDLAELKLAGVKAKIDKGKITVAEDSLMVKKGEVVSQKAAAVLNKLGVTSREIGIEVTAILENGTIYGPDVLNIDEEGFIRKLQEAYLKALNFSINTGFFTKNFVELFIITKVGSSKEGLKALLKSKGYEV